MMNFLHPWFLAVGFATVAVPVAVHYLTKPRPRLLPLSTVRFVRQAVQQKRARYRLRDLLVLLLRAAAVVLLGWAFSRPMSGAKPLIAPGSPGDAVRVVLLDSSMSMAAVDAGQSAFDRGRSAAAHYVQYQPGLRADLLLSAAQPNSVFDTASSNFGALRQSLSIAAPLPQELKVQEALNRASEIFGKSAHAPNAKMELVIISDFQRSSWAGADFSPLPKEVLIQFESVAPKTTPANLAVLRAAAVGRVEQGREAKLEVDIGNYSSTVREVQLDVTAGDATCHLTGLCPPNVTTTLTGTIVPKSAGWISGSARLLGMADALPMDDQRAFVLNVRPPPMYALITRDSALPHVSSSHFLERALVPIIPRDGQTGERVVRLDPAQPDRDTLAAASLLVLDHPGKLSPETINLLSSIVRRGRSLLYVAADPVDATNLKMLADAAGSDLKMPVEFQPPTANTVRSDLFILEWKKDQAPFKAIAETMGAAAASLRFTGGLVTRQLDTGLQDDVLARFSDRSAALVVTSCGAGSLAVLNADLGTSNLPASEVFVPMIGELCAQLLAANQSKEPTACGEPLAADLPADITATAGLSVVDESGKTDAESTLKQEGSFVIWRSDAAGPPGVYKVVRGDDVVYAAATAVPASESDLQPLDPDTLKTRLAAGRNVYFQTAGGEPARDQAWAWILVACPLCILMEFGVLKAFRS